MVYTFSLGKSILAGFRRLHRERAALSSRPSLYRLSQPFQRKEPAMDIGLPETEQEIEITPLEEPVPAPSPVEEPVKEPLPA